MTKLELAVRSTPQAHAAKLLIDRSLDAFGKATFWLAEAVVRHLSGHDLEIVQRQCRLHGCRFVVTPGPWGDPELRDRLVVTFRPLVTPEVPVDCYEAKLKPGQKGGVVLPRTYTSDEVKDMLSTLAAQAPEHAREIDSVAINVGIDLNS